MHSLTTLDQLRTACRDVRKHHRWSQTRVAEMMGTNQQWVSSFESGRTDPPASMVLRLAVLLGMQPAVQSVEDQLRREAGRAGEQEIEL